MIGTCRLCKYEAELCKSHLHPDFAIDWLRKTGNGYFRQATKPNERQQDGPKFDWLCQKCEQRFSTREKYFAENVFIPYLESNVTEFSYDERLFYFCISYLWRSLVIQIENKWVSQYRFADLVFDAEEKWRRYLLGQSTDPGYSSVQLFLSEILPNSPVPTRKFNNYMARAMDVTVARSRSECFAYAKFARFLFFGYLTPCKQDDWVNTQILQSGGKLSLPQKILDGNCGDFFVSRAKESTEIYESRVTAKSRRVIEKSFYKLGDDVLSKDAFRVQMADYSCPVQEFGANRPIGKVGRNDLCPCGSGIKFKRCHGKPWF